MPGVLSFDFHLLQLTTPVAEPMSLNSIASRAFVMMCLTCNFRIFDLAWTGKPQDPPSGSKTAFYHRRDPKYDKLQRILFISQLTISHTMSRELISHVKMMMMMSQETSPILLITDKNLTV